MTAPFEHDRLISSQQINGARFRAYVEQALAPTLRAGDIVMIDNLAAHKVNGVRRGVAAASASLL